MSHMWAPLIIICKTSQSPSVFCHQLRFYMFCCRRKVSLFCRQHRPFMFCCNEKLLVLLWARTLNLQMRRECKETPFKYFPKIGGWEFWGHCWFLQALLHDKGSRFRVWGLQFSCSFVLSLIVFNTNCLGTHVSWGFAHKEVVLH
jgi:hypothetical protein